MYKCTFCIQAFLVVTSVLIGFGFVNSGRQSNDEVDVGERATSNGSDSDLEQFYQLLESVRVATQSAVHHIGRGDLTKAHEVLKVSKPLLEAFNGGLNNYTTKASRAALDGIKFSQNEGIGESIPGTLGLIQVWLGQFGDQSVPIEIRTYDGEVLSSLQTLFVEKSVSFQVSDVNYVLQLDKIRRPRSGDNIADFQITRGSTRAPSRGTSYRSRLDGNLVSVEPVELTLLKLFATGISQLTERINRFESTLDSRAIEQNINLMRSLDEYVNEFVEAFEALRNIQRASEVYYCSAIDLSLIKTNIVEAKPRISDSDVIVKLGGDSFLVDVEIDARVLEIHSIGRRYGSRTTMATKFPFKLRDDIKIDQSIDLRYARVGRRGAAPRAAERYWVALTPPTANKRFFRESGWQGNNTRILIAIPVIDN